MPGSQQLDPIVTEFVATLSRSPGGKASTDSLHRRLPAPRHAACFSNRMTMALWEPASASAARPRLPPCSHRSTSSDDITMTGMAFSRIGCTMPFGSVAIAWAALQLVPVLISPGAGGGFEVSGISIWTVLCSYLLIEEGRWVTIQTCSTSHGDILEYRAYHNAQRNSNCDPRGF